MTGEAAVPLAVEAASLPLVRERMTRVEAAGFVMYRLSCGDTLTPEFLSVLTGIPRKQCWALLAEVSRTAPIYSEDGHWRLAAPVP